MPLFDKSDWPNSQSKIRLNKKRHKYIRGHFALAYNMQQAILLSLKKSTDFCYYIKERIKLHVKKEAF